jgi:hypothetical protein
VLAFADLSDSDVSSSDASDEEDSRGAAAGARNASAAAPLAALPDAAPRPPPPAAHVPVAPAQPARLPLAPRMDLLNSPAPRMVNAARGHKAADASLLGSSSPSGALPPVHGTVAPGMYTYFDIHRGELVTARLAVDAGPGVLMQPPAEEMLVHVPQEDEATNCYMPPDEAAAQTQMAGCYGDACNVPGNCADLDALLPPMPRSHNATAPAAARSQARRLTPKSGQGLGAAVLSVASKGAVAATCVGLALLGFKHRGVGVTAASACATHARRAWHAAATTGHAMVTTALSAGEAQPRMTEWQRTSSTTLPKQSVPRSKEGPRREVRWNPSVSVGRG